MLPSHHSCKLSQLCQTYSRAAKASAPDGMLRSSPNRWCFSRQGLTSNLLKLALMTLATAPNLGTSTGHWLVNTHPSALSHIALWMEVHAADQTWMMAQECLGWCSSTDHRTSPNDTHSTGWAPRPALAIPAGISHDCHTLSTAS